MVLTHIHIAPTHGSQVVGLNEVEAVAGAGLVGDRNFGREREVTLVCSGELALAAAELGIGLVIPGSTRRNLTLDVRELPRSTGTRIQIGDVEMEVRRDCSPCETMETAVGPGARAALVGRAGISARVVVGGSLRVGDPVKIGGESTLP